MPGCVVNQKPLCFYMCSNACMLGMKACMHVVHVFQNYIFNPGVQGALHEKDRIRGSKNHICQNQ